MKRKRGWTHVCHDGNEKEHEAFPMLEHVCFWKLDAYGKDADREDDPGQFEGNVVFCCGVPPGPWVKDSGTIWT